MREQPWDFQTARLACRDASAAQANVEAEREYAERDYMEAKGQREARQEPCDRCLGRRRTMRFGLGGTQRQVCPVCEGTGVKP